VSGNTGGDCGCRSVKGGEEEKSASITNSGKNGFKRLVRGTSSGNRCHNCHGPGGGGETFAGAVREG